MLSCPPNLVYTGENATFLSFCYMIVKSSALYFLTGLSGHPTVLYQKTETRSFSHIYSLVNSVPDGALCCA